ncbi:hypothetical protein BJX65DRAFT_88031 [Aspergillus insuetus]
MQKRLLLLRPKLCSCLLRLPEILSNLLHYPITGQMESVLVPSRTVFLVEGLTKLNDLLSDEGWNYNSEKHRVAAVYLGLRTAW